MQADDRLAIHDLVSRYADAVNQRDADAWASTWDAEAVWDLGQGRRVEGIDDIVALWLSTMATFGSVIQQVTHGTVSGDAATATGHWSIFEVSERDEGPTLFVGRYRDRYVLRASGWRFSERLLDVAYRGGLPPGAFTLLPPLSGNEDISRERTP